MKITALRTALAAAPLAIAVAVSAPVASAEGPGPDMHWLGTQAELVNGDVVQGWTISDLRPSSPDTIIPYPVAGTLWQATASDTAIRGTVIPIISDLNARARDGQTYRVLWTVATPQGVNPSTLAQGQTTTGTVYFDVVGTPPDSVVYNAGGVDLIVWVQPPPQPGGGGASTSSYPLTPLQPGSPGEPAEAAEDGAAEGQAAPPVGDSQGTPLTDTTTPDAPPPAGGPGTPDSTTTSPGDATSEGTPAPATSPATPDTSQGTPAPATSEGTPAPATSPATPDTSQGTPAPATSEGTPPA